MKNTNIKLLLAILLSTMPAIVNADAAYDSMKKKLDDLNRQLQDLKKSMEDHKKTTVSKDDVKYIKSETTKAMEWRNPNTLVHLAGYADVGYTKAQNSDGSFVLGSFSPIFHFLYRDKVMLESELEIEQSSDDKTEVNLEYLTIDLFLNDNLVLVAGKFLSPIGQFRQNMHPSWINKLPSAPPGFGHDGAAPVSEIGLQARGAFYLGNRRTNYSLYVGNGPKLTTAWDGSSFELDGVDAEGTGTDNDGKKVLGGRIGITPMAKMEVGLSFATGKATVTNIEDDIGTAPALSGEAARSYKVVGFDASWQHKGFDLRGEYIKTKVGSAVTGVSASEGGTWSTWYVQTAYRFSPSKYEAVLRYTNFDAHGQEHDQKQLAIGLNYLFTNNTIIKFAYEKNDGVSGSTEDANRYLFQVAYGF